MQFLLDGFRDHLELFFVKIILFLIGVGAAEHDFIFVHSSVLFLIDIVLFYIYHNNSKPKHFELL